MPDGPPWRILEIMTPLRRRVAIAVSPRLLGDALSKVLTDEDCDVVVLPFEAGVGERHFDIVLVTGTAPSTVDADVVIRLPETPAIGVALVGEQRVPLRTLDDLIALVALVAPAG